MADKFLNKYRIPSARLANWNYADNAAYFITICTKYRKHFFGEIENNEMHLNTAGKYAAQFWAEIPLHFEYIYLENFVVMPNHIHGIVIIDKPENFMQPVIETLQPETLHCNVSTENKNESMSAISPKPGSISTILRSYKSVVSRNVHAILPSFDWQTRFHDHIIRNQHSFVVINHYIANNVLNWKDDKFFNDGL